MKVLIQFWIPFVISRFWRHQASWLRAHLVWKKTSSSRNHKSLMHQLVAVAHGDYDVFKELSPSTFQYDVKTFHYMYQKTNFNLLRSIFKICLLLMVSFILCFDGWDLHSRRNLKWKMSLKNQNNYHSKYMLEFCRTRWSLVPLRRRTQIRVHMLWWQNSCNNYSFFQHSNLLISVVIFTIKRPLPAMWLLQLKSGPSQLFFRGSPLFYNLQFFIRSL